MEWRESWTTPSLVGAATFAIGFGIGYGLCSRRKSSIIHYVEIQKEPDVDAVVLDTEAASGDETTEYFGAQVIEIVETEAVEEVTVSVFPDVDPDWDYEKELKTRGRERPYIIHKDEFYNQEKGYGQSTITYYEGDDVLVDEHEVPIYNPKDVVGELIFGKGSGDPNVVHVRNDHLEAEYEVLRDTGFYAVEVLGAQTEDQLSESKPIIHKLRQDR